MTEGDDGPREEAEELLDALVAAQDRLLAVYQVTRALARIRDHEEAVGEILTETLRLTGSDGALFQGAGCWSAGDAALLTAVEGGVDVPPRHAVAESRGANGLPVAVALAPVPVGEDTCLLTLARSGRRAYQTSDLKLVESIAAVLGGLINLTQLHRAGVERARIGREHELASTLAQAALHTRLPTIEGWQVYARCDPANLSGGDFYTFAGREGDLWFAVGDVAGKGLPAATVMTRAVAATRGAFALGSFPDAAAALAAVNAELFDFLANAGLFITMVLGRVGAGTGTLEVCNAGHSPVLLSGRDQALAVAPSAPPLGIVEELRGKTMVLELEPGDLLALGSDGMTDQESPDGPMFGHDRFRAELAGGRDRDLTELGDRVFEEVTRYAGSAPVTDDRTLVLLRRGSVEGAMRESSMEFSADLASVRGIGPWLADLLGESVSDETAALFERLELALHELCVNIVEHAYQGSGGAITLSGVMAPSSVTIQIVDSGQPFDEEAVATPVPGVPQVGGYGLMIVRKLVDEVRYARVGQENTWTIQIKCNKS